MNEQSKPHTVEVDGEEIVVQPPQAMDEDWRQAELEKLLYESSGSGGGSSAVSKVMFFGILIALFAGAGWIFVMPAPELSRANVKRPQHAQVELPPPPPPPPPPEPRPYRNLFEVQTAYDGKQFIVYTIQPGDDLSKIGEKLHDVTGAPRVVTYQAVEDAYWRKYFSYDEQNARVANDDQVAERVGELIQIPVPVVEFPSFDLAGGVGEYNES